MKMLVIGCGSIGERHIKNIYSFGNQTIIAYDPNRTKLENLKKSFSSLIISSELKNIWKLNPEIAFICTPTSLHLPQALIAAKHKCHLFIEKPLADSERNIRKLHQIVRMKKIITFVACNWRFYWAISEIRSLLHKKVIGQIFSARISAGSYLPQWHPNEDYRKLYAAQKKFGGGAILDFIHELDYACWLFGEIDKLTGMYGKLSNLQIDTEDCAELLMTIKGGPLVSIHVDYLQRVYERSCTIIGSQGTIVWNFSSHKIKIYSSKTKNWTELSEPKNYDLNQMYKHQLEYFFACIRKNKNTDNDVFHAAKILKYALMFKRKGIHVL
ncbi:TPA: hypothetical protein DIV55_05200 [Patescibacteria group bacterium]|uniref:Oxidoreductase domain protein n=1 Tax=Candidatus Gottesmanbacteria bacterium GW2011_GWA1_43_11 TaxID=1618436 RepID=A0A0G1CLF8_9BACT|nr:MAG: Oxidoreductase domain protein [Candidatus Gottesmanbacteria bacterium GW2011_GWA1_43_11]HCS79106.1 hypothetical protein [Patescibacteria group bacterium]